MGPCTSSTKAKHPKQNENPPAAVAKQNSGEGQANIIKTACTAERSHKDEQRNTENFEGDPNLHLTPASQNCLRNIQDKKFLTSIRSNPIEIKQNSDPTLKNPDTKDQRKGSATLTGKTGENNDAGATLASKRPNFQKQIETKQIDLKISLKNNKPKKLTK